MKRESWNIGAHTAVLCYIGKRLVGLFCILLGLSFFVFALTYILPSDPVQQLLSSMGATQDPELVAAMQARYGLDKSFLEQYFSWLSGVLQGNLGTSVYYDETVNSVLMRKLPNTIRLAVVSFLLTVVISFPLGAASALYRNKFVDYVIRFLSFVGMSMPGFWVGLILMYWLAVEHRLLPVSGNSGWISLVLPSITLSIGLSALFIRRIRAAMLEQMDSLYTIGEQARGISRPRIILRHVLPNSMLTLITLLGMSFGDLLGGTMVVETIFGWNGVGATAIEAISNRDYQLIQGYVLWVGTIYVVINLLVDLSYKYLDPRIRLEKENGDA